MRRDTLFSRSAIAMERMRKGVTIPHRAPGVAPITVRESLTVAVGRVARRACREGRRLSSPQAVLTCSSSHEIMC